MPRTIEFYETHLKDRFRSVDHLNEKDLEWLLTVHDKKVEYFKEERKMHFGAFALVTVLFFLLLPVILAGGEFIRPLLFIEGLLFILMVPYVFYYAWYENRLRKLEEFYFVILEALVGMEEKEIYRETNS
ncbi:MAG: hypothetical protein JW885_01515 [Deltaproteobacteria bacterium]|nr:hypothetical protein [Candidatus Zymogenaceae bacterium]